MTTYQPTGWPAFAMDDLIESTGVGYRSLRMSFFLENLLNQVESIENRATFFMANSCRPPTLDRR